MTKKMKGVALDSSPYGVYGDGKTMFKHQSLMQDYQDLQKDVTASRNKLENMKQRKGILLAEVRFLRQRYKHLMKRKSLNLQQERGKELVQPHHLENKKNRSMKKVQIPNQKNATPPMLPPVFKPNLKGRVYMGKEVSHQNTIPSFYWNHKELQHSGENAARIIPTTTTNLNSRGRSNKGKEVARQNPMPVDDLNQHERIYKSHAVHTPVPLFDLNCNETAFSGKQPPFQSRVPVFDLNQISMEEEEFQDTGEQSRFEEPKKGLFDEEQQLSDLKLSICRNVGDGSNRAGKRKISWQDPVALRV